MTVIKSNYDKILYESNQHTIKKTVEEAVLKKANLQGANLRGANLRGANLRGANLQGANLRGADLEGANLRGADLEGADLEGADLEGADLRGADLEGADLEGANLRGADLEGADLEGANLRGAIKLPIFCKWSHGITNQLIHIGCEKKTIDDWDIFFDSDQIIQTPRNTEEFKQIQAVYLAYRAYLTHLKS